jgi:hypothetical protein
LAQFARSIGASNVAFRGITPDLATAIQAVKPDWHRDRPIRAAIALRARYELIAGDPRGR